MSNTQDDKAERLRQARAEKFDSPTEAARAMGIEPPTYLGHENASRGFNASAQRYADFFGVSLEWLLSGRGAMKSGAPTAQISDGEREKVPDLTVPTLNIPQWPRDVPILGGASCGDDGMFELNGQTLGFTKRPPALIGVKDAYALYIYGDSMAPWKENGRLVLVHPHLPVRINDYVVLQLHAIGHDGTPAAYIKRLIKRSADRLVLQQYSPPEEKSFSLKKVKAIHRIVDLDEMIGL